MTREEAIKNIKEHCYFANLIPQAKEALNMAIKALEQEPCKDCISRQAALNTISKVIGGQNDFADCIRDSVEAVINACPSVKPKAKTKTGHWIEEDGYDGDTYYDCSACGDSWTTVEGTPWDNGMNYCPHCGAKMENEE